MKKLTSPMEYLAGKAIVITCSINVELSDTKRKYTEEELHDVYYLIESLNETMNKANTLKEHIVKSIELQGA